MHVGTRLPLPLTPPLPLLRSVLELLPGLVSLPCLASLYVTLPQGELDALVSGLPHLTSLNGTQLDEATGDSAPPGPVVHPGEGTVCRGRCSFVLCFFSLYVGLIP